MALTKNLMVNISVNRWGGAAAILGTLLALQIGAAVAATPTKPAKPKQTIKDVMKVGFRGDTSLRSKIVAGTATPAQKKQFLTLTEALAANKPPKGEQSAWDEKVSTLVKASHDLLDGAPAAALDADKLAAFKTASDCKSCHMAHKGN